MKIQKTPFEGLVILEPSAYHDERGFFMESFNEKTLKSLGIDIRFIQDNQSYSKHNVIRGLHYQKQPHGQTKLVRALSGRILDVVVDLRTTQPTFKQSYSIELTAENRLQLLIPVGFAHGFRVLSDHAEVLYKTDAYYHPASEGGVFYNDPEWKIDWGVSENEAILSGKDLLLPLANDHISEF